MSRNRRRRGGNYTSAVVSSFRTSSRSPLLQVLKTSVAAVSAWLLSNFVLDQPLPIFAAIAALLVVQPSVNQSLAKGIERSFGVILGVLIAYGAGVVFGSSSWLVLAVIVVSLLLAWALRLTPGSANQLPITAMLVLAIGGVDTPAYAIDRVLETLIGAGAGLLINVAIVPPVLIAPAHRAVHDLAAAVSDTLEDLADSLRAPRSSAQLSEMLITARLLRPMQYAATEALIRADESLLLNPRRSTHRDVLGDDHALMRRLAILVTRVLGIARAIHDRYDESLATEPMARAVSVELDRAAHDLRLLARQASPEEEDEAHDMPALTAPLHIPVPHPDHWILIGTLMEDIRRVREEITSIQEH